MMFRKSRIPVDANGSPLTSYQFRSWNDDNYRMEKFLGWMLIAIGLLEASQSVMYFFLF